MMEVDEDIVCFYELVECVLEVTEEFGVADGIWGGKPAGWYDDDRPARQVDTWITTRQD